MLGSATVLLSALRGQRAGGADPHATAHPSGFGVIDGGRGRRTSGGRSSSGFMDTLQARWRRRKERGGF